jgi:hypothetical protein
MSRDHLICLSCFVYLFLGTPAHYYSGLACVPGSPNCTAAGGTQSTPEGNTPGLLM